ncbi:MAG: isochorismate synthase [Verrucomicrobia bacterium]|nr:isochorismate synthase [Verrucomicrobiota bacterium]
MQFIDTDRHRNPDRDSLLLLLRACRDEAEEDNHFKLISIAINCSHMDPLAVLDSIADSSERHFYLEQPNDGVALAGADAVLLGTFEGESRFDSARRWAEDVLDHTVVLGDLQHPFSGPHFFCGFTFADVGRSANAPFAPATVMVPRWQVGRLGWDSVAVANIRVDADSDPVQLADRVWSAYNKFKGFDYNSAPSVTAKASVQSAQPEDPLAYQERVSKALESIRAGLYAKIVLARTVELHFDRTFESLSTVADLRTDYPGCHVFSFTNGAGAAFFGASPERLLRIRDHSLQTVAIAGSEPRGDSVQQDARLARGLLTSRKDLHEHQLVVDSIERRLRKVGATAIQRGKPDLIQLSNVQHIVTPITAIVPETCHPLAAVAEMHPTPAVGGTPRAPACAAIPLLETFDRGLYAGVLGWFNHRGDGDFIVGLRAALAQASTVTLYAGAGIVEGSDPAKEFLETEAKLRAVWQTIDRNH